MVDQLGPCLTTPRLSGTSGDPYLTQPDAVPITCTYRCWLDGCQTPQPALHKPHTSLIPLLPSAHSYWFMQTLIHSTVPDDTLCAGHCAGLCRENQKHCPPEVHHPKGRGPHNTSHRDQSIVHSPKGQGTGSFPRAMMIPCSSVSEYSQGGSLVRMALPLPSLGSLHSEPLLTPPSPTPDPITPRSGPYTYSGLRGPMKAERHIFSL